MLNRKKINSYALIEASKGASHIEDIVKNLPSVLEQTFGVILVQFAITLEYDDEISNSHTSPLSGIKNWHRDWDLPTSYEGFTGFINFRVVKPKHITFFSSMFTDTLNFKDYALFGFNTRSGGGGAAYAYRSKLNKEIVTAEEGGYQCNIFIDDYPDLKNALTRHRNKLKLLTNSESERKTRFKSETKCIYSFHNELYEPYTK